MIIFITVLSIIVIVVGILVYFIITHKRYRNFILQNSECLKQLNEINSRYSFYPYIDFNQSHKYDNQNFYNNISCTDFLIYQLQFIRKKVIDQISKINTNKQNYSNYLNEINAIKIFGQFNCSVGKLNIKKLIKIEMFIIEKQTYKPPITQFALTVTLYCTKINGHVYNKKSQIYTADDIFALSKRLSAKRGTFYIDREIWDALCRVERGKVSNKMRFSIYARDGYRCCNCGISNRYTPLEIDHIIPIAKGGKSTFDNLQSLCRKCNVEKGDKI